jgi:hypothetical protein
MSRAPEERAMYVGLVLVGALPMLPVLVSGGHAGAGFTIGFLMTASGMIGMVFDTWSRRRPPPVARTVSRSSRAQTR